MNNNSIIVYRSEMERMRDEFWMDFLSSNASWLQYVFNAFIALFFILVLFIIVTVVRGVFKPHKPFRR